MQSEREKHPRLEWNVFSPFLIESFQVFAFWGKVFRYLIINFDCLFETFYIWMCMHPFAIPDVRYTSIVTVKLSLFVISFRNSALNPLLLPQVINM